MVELGHVQLCGVLVDDLEVFLEEENQVFQEAQFFSREEIRVAAFDEENWAIFSLLGKDFGGVLESGLADDWEFDVSGKGRRSEGEVGACLDPSKEHFFLFLLLKSF